MGWADRLDMMYTREKSRMNSELVGLRKEVTEMETTIGRVSLTRRSCFGHISLRYLLDI